MPLFQQVGQKLPLDRKRHVWLKRKDGSYKCVVCGGITARPTDDGLCERYEPLTQAELALDSPESRRK